MIPGGGGNVKVVSFTPNRTRSVGILLVMVARMTRLAWKGDSLSKPWTWQTHLFLETGETRVLEHRGLSMKMLFRGISQLSTN